MIAIDLEHAFMPAISSPTFRSTASWAGCTSAASERIIPHTVDGLRPFRIPHIITGDCTGWRALHALADAFGDAVSQSAVGTKYTFDAEHYLSL